MIQSNCTGQSISLIIKSCDRKNRFGVWKVEIRFLHKYVASSRAISDTSQWMETQGLTLDPLEVLFLAVGLETSGGSPVEAEVEYKLIQSMR